MVTFGDISAHVDSRYEGYATNRCITPTHLSAALNQGETAYINGVELSQSTFSKNRLIPEDILTFGSEGSLSFVVGCYSNPSKSVTMNVKVNNKSYTATYTSSDRSQVIRTDAIQYSNILDSGQQSISITLNNQGLTQYSGGRYYLRIVDDQDWDLINTGDIESVMINSGKDEYHASISYDDPENPIGSTGSFVFWDQEDTSISLNAVLEIKIDGRIVQFGINVKVQ